MSVTVKMRTTEQDQTFGLRSTAQATPVVNSDYAILTNKPSINGVELLGNKTSAELGLVDAADYDPDEKTSGMTQAVGLDENGKLWTIPSGTGPQGEDGNGIASAGLNADYTLTLTYTDGTTYTTPSIRGETGATGPQGPQGETGATGKTAYASAVDGGYTGTEAQFNADLAAVSSKYEKPASGIPASDLASGVIPTVPSAYTGTPLMDGTASAGSSSSWARGDHRHPTDTTRAAASSVPASATVGSTGLITFSNSGGTQLFTVQLPLYDGGVT